MSISCFIRRFTGYSGYSGVLSLSAGLAVFSVIGGIERVKGDHKKRIGEADVKKLVPGMFRHSGDKLLEYSEKMSEVIFYSSSKAPVYNW